MKGDCVTVTYQTEPGHVTEIAVTAMANGRHLNIETDNKARWFIVRELTRGDTRVRELKVRLDNVIAINITGEVEEE